VVGCRLTASCAYPPQPRSGVESQGFTGACQPAGADGRAEEGQGAAFPDKLSDEGRDLSSGRTT